MKVTLAGSLKALTMVFAFVLILGQGVARADEVTFSIITSSGTQLEGLSFSGLSSPFSGTTTNGFLNVPLGAISLSDNADMDALIGQQFELTVTFILPQGITGGGSPTFFSTLIAGTIQGEEDKGTALFLLLPGDTLPFTFGNSTGTGSFNFALVLPPETEPPLHLRPGETIALQGQIGGAVFKPVPEPATMLLLATGLAGVAGAARRRLRRGAP